MSTFIPIPAILLYQLPLSGLDAAHNTLYRGRDHAGSAFSMNFIISEN